MLIYLYKNWNWFRSQINRINFNNQSKPTGFADLKEAFIDSKGKKYYTWPNEMLMPILRFNKLQEYVLELQNCFTGDELKVFFKAMHTALDDAMNAPEGGKKNKIYHVSKIGFLLKEAEMRTEILVHPEILFAITSAVYVREDQNPNEWDQEIEDQKIKQFKEDSKGGLSDFFYRRGLKEFIPYLKEYEGDLEPLLKQYQESNERWMQAMKITGSEQKDSASKEKIPST